MAHSAPSPRSFVVLAASVGSLIFITTPETQAQTWNLGTATPWTTASSWNPATVPNAIGAAVTFNGAASANNPVQTANRAIVVDLDQTVGSIVFNNDLAGTFTNSLTSGTTGKLILDEIGAGPATITTMNAVGTGNNTISKAMTLTDSLVATVNHISASSAAGSLPFTGQISGPGGFTKNGDGLATFSNTTKTYTGPTILNGGRMRISEASAPTASSSFTINAGAQLTLISSASVYNLGAGSLFLNGNGPTTGPFAGTPGAIRQDTNTIITVANPVVLQSPTVIHVQATTTASLTFPNNVSGPGSLALGGIPHDNNLGKLVLSGANTYQGGSFVNAGDLVVSGANASLGTGDVTVFSGANQDFFFALARLSLLTGVVNGIADTATLSLAGGSSPGVADNGYVLLESGINETVGGLRLGGVAQLIPGIYGSIASGAQFQSDEYFSGPGVVTLIPEPASAAILLAGLGALATRRRRA
jgi:fibronectin-binding autotransporter adhesin